jgi:hypothetical protein
MYWYNPKSHTSERVEAPQRRAGRTHACGTPGLRNVREYAELRRSGAPIERALVSVGHEERLREHEHAPVRLAWRERPRRARPRRARPSAGGYELLMAVRLKEEGKDRRKGRRSQAEA